MVFILDRNIIELKDGKIHEIKSLDSRIMSLVYFWASQQKVDLTSQLLIIRESTGTIFSIVGAQVITHLHGAEIGLDGEEFLLPHQLVPLEI